MGKMKQLYLKTFKKNQIVCLKLFYPDRRHKSFYVIPEPGGKLVKHDGMAFTMNPDYVYHEKGIPTFVYNTLDPSSVPVMIDPKEWEKSEIDPDEFNAALDQRIAKDLYRGFPEKLTLQMAIAIMALITIASVGAVWYMLNEQLSTMQQIIDSQQPVIDALRDKLVTGGFD